jgi:Ca2+-binding RTX toxin-like protein
MSNITNPGTTDFAFPTGGGNSVLIPVQDDALSLSAAASISSGLQAELTAGTITPYTYDGSSSPFNPPAGNTELIVDTGTNLLLPTNVSDVLVNTGSFVTLSAAFGTTQQNVVSGVGGIDLQANNGTGTILAAGGDNQIAVSAGGNHEIVTGAGDDTIFVTHGNNTVSGGAGNNTIVLGDGNNNVISTGADQINAARGLATGGTDTINAAMNTNSVNINGSRNDIEFINGSGVSSLNGQSGSDTVFGGSGGGSFSGGSAGNNLLIGGTGAVDLTGGGSGDVLALTFGNASNLLTAGSGNETLFGGFASGANTFQAGSGTDLVIGGLGNDTLQAGTGNASIAGSLGSNQFLFVDGQAGGVDTLLDFSLSSTNKVDLQGYGSGAATAALAGKVVSGGNTTITLSDHTSITFLNDTNLKASNFIVS